MQLFTACNLNTSRTVKGLRFIGKKEKNDSDLLNIINKKHFVKTENLYCDRNFRIVCFYIQQIK